MTVAILATVGAGLGAGLGQALLLRLSARHAGLDALGMLLRLGLVGGVLTGAALAGQLLACAAAWALGLGVGALVLLRRWS